MLQSGRRVGKAEVMSEADVGGTVDCWSFQGCKEIAIVGGERILLGSR